MRYVTISMLCAHAKKHRVTVIRALRNAGVNLELIPGCRGHRIPEKEANKFLLRQWPEVGPFPINAIGS